MAIKSLKSTISICETQKMLHQWKIGGVSDSACLKLLDIYLGMPTFMNKDGIYPISNLYQICLALKTVHTSDLLDYIKKCKSFELVWNENKTELLAFFTPLWHSKTTDFISPAVSPAVSPAETNSASDNNIINNNILYNISPSENPGGSETQNHSLAKEFFHRLNATPEEKKLVLVPIIDCIITRYNYTRPRALNTLIILVNDLLIPYFDSQPRFAKTSHAGRTIWLQNLIKSRHGDTLMQQATQKLSATLLRGMENQRKKRREFRPVSPFEWKDAEKNIRYYDDPLDGTVEIPNDAPPRPGENAIWNILSCEWVVISI